MEVPTPTKFEDSMILHVAYNNREMCQDEYRWEFYKREMGYGNLAGQAPPATGFNTIGGTSFGTTATNSPFGQFGAIQPQSAQAGGGLIGSCTTGIGGGLFGSSTNAQSTGGGGLFGSNNSGAGTGTGGGGLFGSNSTIQPAGGNMFGQTSQNTFSFGNYQPQQQQVATSAQYTNNIFNNLPNPQAIHIDKNHALGVLIDSVDFDSIGAGMAQFWTNTKTELSVNEQIANEPSMVVPTFTSANTSSPYLGNLPDFENRFDPYNLEPILKQIGKPNKIYHLMNINEMKPTFNIDYSTVHGQEFSSMFHIGESKYVPGKQIQSKSQNSLNNVLKKFWDKSLGTNIEDLQNMNTHELSSGALLFTKQSNRNPFKTSIFAPLEINSDSCRDFDQKVDVSQGRVQQFSLECTSGIQTLTDKLLSQLNTLKATEIEQLKLTSPNKSSKLCAPKLTKAYYYTTPSIESLSMMTEEQLAAVCDLTIRHEKFGEVLWPGFTDVREMDFDKVVNFSYKSFSLYQDMTTCIPPAGHGLNKTAIITLYKCVPTGNFTEEKNREIVKNMEAYTKSINCEFISASTETGNWKFKSIADKHSGTQCDATVYSAHLCKFVC
ncbi:Nucleoporin autopeptidase [Babesia microti strain RI]|uniref:Nucleoporin autopeptidase n=1 Tax=Babesia microti (strain RI) TaxID=1133968 RepID=I7J8T9_BABMR|nr:Nucleoporin autopeptidase [Babesia microti strain RI]CCF75593.1 Nucleoporin autopeptidase [Babesia microti strain RI]|eukprot:XP_012650001.1 Nucleoporin autopeptidase [Babesia microti strain RI]